MLILLPPSEGKAAPRAGRPLDLGTLAFPALADARTRVLDALVAASRAPDALEILKVGESLAGPVRANVALWDAPTAPACAVYSGVLYDAFGYGALDAAARRRARASVLVFSALLGPLRLADRIPAYRLSGGCSLPGIGPLGAYWRDALAGVLPDDALVVDARSAAYRFVTPPGALAVRVFREERGRRTPVSHLAKHARGLVARALCEAARTPRTPQQAAAAASVWFARHPVTTAAGAPVSVRVELGPDGLGVVTD